MSYLLPEGQTPYLQTSKRPEEILGADYDLYIKHWRAWQKCEGAGTYMSKAFSEEERRLVGKLNNELMDAGYRVFHILDSGKIEWSVITMSKR